jgi:casein kinase II subunit beta
MNKQDDMFDEDSESQGGWIQWFCELEGHEFFAEVDDEFVRDSFNLYGLKQYIPSRYE